ncbi:MAG: Sensor protein ZraS [Syntrophorhabdus sp. PtaU1.Bin153]|nr:MAG: Sensor protein ZraS [Syntrophorhabdus sp. PtaU1.Bin153]
MKKPLKNMNPTDVLGKVIAISHSNLETEARINSILNIIAQDMSFDEVLVYTLDSDKLLTCRFMNSRSKLFHLLNQYRSRVGEGVVGSVAQKRMSQHYTYRDVPPRFGCLFYPDLNGFIKKLRTFSFLPLSDDSYLYGVLFIGSAGTDRLTDADKILLSIFTREIGGILRSHQLVVSSKKRISELATLSELGRVLSSNSEPRTILGNISFIITKALNAGFTTIRLGHAFIKLDSQRYTCGEIDTTTEKEIARLEEEVKRSGKTASSREFLQDQLQEAVAAFYTAPIASKDRFLGTLTVGGPRSVAGLAVEESSRYLVETIANYISSGIENSLLNMKLKDLVDELGKAQQRLVEQETFRSLGEMTASIAHEIKNPLVIIGGFTKRLAKKARLDQTENRYVEIILKEVGRLESILDEILNYVRENPMLLRGCNINDFLDELLYLFASDIAWEKIEISRDFDRDVPLVPCDDQQMKQVLINILVNAYDAMHGAGKISIRTEQKQVGSHPFVTISITDTGGGVDPKIIDNVFNPFFTTKERGTGLGLAISNKIVMNHGGHIEVNNVTGKGAQFIVYLPQKNSIIQEEIV